MSGPNLRIVNLWYKVNMKPEREDIYPKFWSWEYYKEELFNNFYSLSHKISFSHMHKYQLSYTLDRRFMHVELIFHPDIYHTQKQKLWKITISWWSKLKRFRCWRCSMAFRRPINHWICGHISTVFTHSSSCTICCDVWYYRLLWSGVATIKHFKQNFAAWNNSYFIVNI